MNSDGIPDLLERADDGRLYFLSGRQNADSTAQGRYLGPGWNTMTQVVRHGDYNGDGHEDVYARDSAGVLWLYPGRGDGTLRTRIRVGGGWNSMREITAAGDLTGDGHRDLLARDTTGTLWRYPGTGRGGFSTRARVGGGWNSMSHLASPGDLTGDGKADLLAVDTAGTMWLYPGTGKGAFGNRTKPTTRLSHQPVIATGDLNGDAVPDVLQPSGDTLDICSGTGHSTLTNCGGESDWDTAAHVRVF
jgi:hypothetical protein